MKIQIENLKAQVRGRNLTLRQRADATTELDELLRYIENLEAKVLKLNLPINNKSFCSCDIPNPTKTRRVDRYYCSHCYLPIAK